MNTFSLSNLPSGNILCFSDSKQKRQQFIHSVREQNKERKEYTAVEKGFHEERKREIRIPAMFLYAGETFPTYLGKGVEHLAKYGKTYNTLVAFALSSFHHLSLPIAHHADIVFLGGEIPQKYKERLYRLYGLNQFSTYEAFCEVLNVHNERNTYLVFPFIGKVSSLVLEIQKEESETTERKHIVSLEPK